MENMTKDELNRIRAALTMSAKTGNDALAIAIDFLLHHDKKNPSASNARKIKEGFYTVDVSYDAENDHENDYMYRYTK